MFSLFKIEWNRMFRNKKYLFISVLMPIVYFLIFSSILKPSKGTSNNTFNIEFLMSMTTFCLASFALFNFPFDIMEDRTNGWNNTLKKVPISNFKIIVVKICKMSLESAVSIILVFFTGYIFKEIVLTLSQWIVSGILLLLGSTILLSLGTILTLFKNMQTASVFSNILYLGLSILGGLMFPLEYFPKWIQTVGKLTPTYNIKELAIGYINNGSVPYSSIMILIIYGFIFLIIYFILSHDKT